MLNVHGHVSLSSDYEYPLKSQIHQAHPHQSSIGIILVVCVIILENLHCHTSRDNNISYHIMLNVQSMHDLNWSALGQCHYFLLLLTRPPRLPMIVDTMGSFLMIPSIDHSLCMIVAVLALDFACKAPNNESFLVETPRFSHLFEVVGPKTALNHGDAWDHRLLPLWWLDIGSLVPGRMARASTWSWACAVDGLTEQLVSMKVDEGWLRVGSHGGLMDE